jgi:outer membrane protein assembly factor BamB
MTMRILRSAALAAIATLITISMLTACAGLHSTALDGAGKANPQLASLLPLPNALHSTSASEVALDGKAYDASWPNGNVAAAGNDGLYSPNYTGATRDLAHLAYAIYSFSVAGYTGDPALYLTFTTEGTASDGWIGLADYSKNRWDWFPLPAPSSHLSTLSITLANRDNAGVMPVAVVFTGTAPWQLSRIKLGNVGQVDPGEWPMAGRDALHSHQVTSQGPQTNALLWRFRCSGPGAQFTGVAAKADGTVYAGSGGSLLAYDASGLMLWDCPAVTPTTVPAIAADGTVYVGGSAPNPGLHAISSTGELVWTYTTSENVLSNPAIAPNGNIYFGCDDGDLYCVKPDGTISWHHNLVLSVRCSPGVDADSNVYIGYATDDWGGDGYVKAFHADGTDMWETSNLGQPCRSCSDVIPSGDVVVGTKDGTLYAINSTGAEHWNQAYKVSAFCRPIADADGMIYVGTKDSTLLAVNPDGSIAWTYTSDSEVSAGPILASDGTIIAGSMNGTLFAVTKTGTEAWTYVTGNQITVAPATMNNVALVASGTGYLSAVDLAGALQWQVGSGGPVTGSPVVTSDGTAYAGSDDGFLYAIRPNGTLKWRYQTGLGISGSPAIGTDGMVYVCSKDKNLYAINPGGTMAWQFTANGLIESSPTLGSDGTIYFGCNDKNVYAIAPDGTQRWAFLTTYQVTGSPAVSATGEVYAGSQGRYVYGITWEGSKDWEYKTDGKIVGGISVGGDGTVYAGCEQNPEAGFVYALSSSGTLKWKFATVGPVRTTPAICADGVMVASSDGYTVKGSIYAINQNGEKKWEYGPVAVSATGLALDVDGVLYAGTQDGRVLALIDNGSSSSVKWTSAGESSLFYTPALAAQKLYIGTGNGVIALGN